MTRSPLPGSAPADVLEGGPMLGARDPSAPKRRAPVRAVCVDCEFVYGKGHVEAPCKHQRAGLTAAGLYPSRPLRPCDYTPGAGGALTGPESALSSLPSCPCDTRAEPGWNTPAHAVGLPCGEPARPHDGWDLRCTAGHVFAGTHAEHEQARGALAAAERRAPHVEAERARTRDRLRAEVEAAKKGGGER
jgi:hypothetical protein